MYIIKADGTRAGGGYTWLRELVIKGLVTGLLSAVTFGIYNIVAPMWCLWDKDRQCLWDKMAGTYVAHSPSGYKPQTANELRLAGEPSPIRQAQALAPPDLARDLSALEELRSAGTITDEEYEQRRQRLIERV